MDDGKCSYSCVCLTNPIIQSYSNGLPYAHQIGSCIALAAHYGLSVGFTCVVSTGSAMAVDYLPTSLGSRVIQGITSKGFVNPKDQRRLLTTLVNNVDRSTCRSSPPIRPHTARMPIAVHSARCRACTAPVPHAAHIVSGPPSARSTFYAAHSSHTSPTCTLCR